jgi:hypothetical protein
MTPSPRFVLSLALLAALPALTVAQVQAISASASYSFAMHKQSNVEEAEAFGGGAELRLGLAGGLAIGLSGAYTVYAIEQPDALNQWEWKFWNDRYYPKIQSDMRADPNLTSQIGYVQSMSSLPVMLSALYDLAPAENLTLTPRIGWGIAFFSRKLYADETWTKQFPDADYTLTYNLRNFAPEKKGDIFLGAIGCDVAYRVAGDLNLTGSAEYRKYFPASGDYGAFPFSDELGFRLGLTFLY